MWCSYEGLAFSELSDILVVDAAATVLDVALIDMISLNITVGNMMIWLLNFVLKRIKGWVKQCPQYVVCVSDCRPVDPAVGKSH